MGICGQACAWPNGSQHEDLWPQPFSHEKVDHHSMVFSHHAMDHFQWQQAGYVQQVDLVWTWLLWQGWCLHLILHQQSINQQLNKFHMFTSLAGPKCQHSLSTSHPSLTLAR